MSETHQNNIYADRMYADVPGGITIFLIGMRINKLWKIWKWFPVFLAMPKMLAELKAHPELGMLHARLHGGLRNFTVLQYWSSAAQLNAYAHAKTQTHLPAWRAFNRNIGTGGDVGIWHETYEVPAAGVESIYVNMPRFGLGLAAPLVSANAKKPRSNRVGAGTPP